MYTLYKLFTVDIDAIIYSTYTENKNIWRTIYCMYRIKNYLQYIWSTI